jgi:cellulose synthase (UDP-forming)
MLLSIALLRKGYLTRYLCERLAFGLAPETVEAFFIQRLRWARGAIQILYLANGPFGRGLTLMQRLLYLPMHWRTLGPRSLIIILAPIVFLWTGISPVFDVSVADVLYYFAPPILALTGGIWVYAPGQNFPLAAQVQSTFLAFRILPTVLQSLVMPFGHAFKVTLKGGTSLKSNYARRLFWTANALASLTFAGLIVNTIPEWRIIQNADALPIVAFWSVINIIVLSLVCIMSLETPARRSEPRLELDEPIWIFGPSGTMSAGRVENISLSGVSLEAASDRAMSAHHGDPVRVFISEVGFVAGTVVRQTGQFLAVQFILPVSVERDLLVRKLFTAGLDTTNVSSSLWISTSTMLASIWNLRAEMLKGGVTQPRDAAIVSPAEKLPAQSLVIPPRRQKVRLSELIEKRRAIAA